MTSTQSGRPAYRASTTRWSSSASPRLGQTFSTSKPRSQGCRGPHQRKGLSRLTQLKLTPHESGLTVAQAISTEPLEFVTSRSVATEHEMWVVVGARLACDKERYSPAHYCRSGRLTRVSNLRGRAEIAGRNTPVRQRHRRSYVAQPGVVAAWDVEGCASAQLGCRYRRSASRITSDGDV
jgi:hypothetical protein